MTAFVLDHVFVFCRPGAPEAAALEAAGLRAGVRRQHPGQGTANVCFGFRDAYLELIWVADEEAVGSAAVQPLALAERARWRSSATSPFGICVRPVADLHAMPPFPCFDYAPGYLPAGSTPIRIAANARGAAEPLLFALARPYTPLDVPHVLAHARVTRAAFTVPGLDVASPLGALRMAGLSCADGTAHGLDLEFDSGHAGRQLDLLPGLPLRLRW